MADDTDRRRELKEAEAGGNQGQKKLPFPKQLAFIVGNEFCERFSYYGMRTVLSIYFISKLNFSEHDATAYFHVFSMLVYFFPIFGAMIADGWLGKYKTIVWISFIYVLGHALKTFAAVPNFLPPVEFSLLGLLLIAIGTGGIKPCVAAFGGDQFKLPEQERQLQTFFSVFYFSINAGSMISTFLTPIFRKDVHCFGDKSCYSLAFGVPAVLMFIATVILILGKKTYVLKPPGGNVIGRVFGSIFYATKKKLTNNENHEHFMDYAKEKYDSKLVEDVKVLLRVLVLYIPLPIFWALFDQQGSRWTFQAIRTDGRVGGYIVKPDQLQLVNPVLILVLIPLFDMVIYPFFAKFNFLIKPLQRIAVGGVIAAIAFVVSGFVELGLKDTYEVLPHHGEAHLHLMNSLPCEVAFQVRSEEPGLFSMSSQSIEESMSAIVKDLEVRRYEVEVRAPECDLGEKTIVVSTEDESVKGVVIRKDERGELEITALEVEEKPRKNKEADNEVRVVLNTGSNSDEVVRLQPIGKGEDSAFLLEAKVTSEGLLESDYATLVPGDYEVHTKDSLVGTIELLQGSVITLYISGDASTGHEQNLDTFHLTKPNSIHMFWLLPQFFIITTAEIMFSITGLEFSYSQAPDTMKSVIQAFWLLTIAFGNLIVTIVAEAHLLEQYAEFFMFAVLMGVDMLLFIYLAYKYVPRKIETEDIKLENQNNNTDASTDM